MRALARSQQQPIFRENKTCRLFRAARGEHSRRAAIGVNAAKQGLAPHVQSVTFRNSGKIALQCIDDGTCGRTAADSCAGVTPYCSVWAVGYDISCGSFDPWSSGVSRTRSGALIALGEG